MSHRNPPSLPVELELAPDFRIRIRHVQPSDKALLRKGLAHFSRRSTYQRFFTPVVTFSEQQLDYLTDVDGSDHVALGALDVTDGSEQGIGIARYIRLPETPHVAEAAVSVIDAYQGRGVGSVLLATLSQFAAAYSIHSFRAYVLAGNRRFLQYLMALGATRQTQGHGIVQIDLPVRAHLADIPEEATTARGAWKCLEVAQSTTQ
jgi:RimJ/RimL family protein N-acetyltransferase